MTRNQWDKLDDISLFSLEKSKNSRQPNLFAVLDQKTREDFASKCTPLMVDPGKPLLFQGDEHTRSYLIEDGLVRTFYVAQNSQEITQGYWSEGDLIGGPDVLGGGVHVRSATASRRTRVLSISGAALKELADNHPQVSHWIIDVLRFKLRWLSILFQIHGTNCMEDRLVRILLLLADNYGEPTNAGLVIKYKISQADLGTLVGASRQWTNKKLQLLRETGLLAFENRQIILRDPAALRSHAHLLTNGPPPAPE